MFSSKVPVHKSLSRSSRTTGFVVASVAALALVAPKALAARSSFKPKFETKLTLNPVFYPDDLGQGTKQLESRLRSESELGLKAGKNLRFKFAPVLLGDPSSPSASERFFADVSEASIEWKKESVRFRGGIIPYAWGATDVYNPLDVVGSRRYFDPLNSDRRGSPSVSAQYDAGDWRVEAVYVPVQLPSVLPGEQSRWLPRDVFVGNTAVNGSSSYTSIQLPPELRYHYRDREVVDQGLSNNYGLQFERRGDGLDFSAVYFEGAPTAPVVLPELTGTLVSTNPDVIAFDPDVYLNPIYYRRRTTGASVVATFESTIVRLAGAYSDRVGTSVRPELPGWAHSAVLGVEQTVPVGEGTMIVLAQGTYSEHEDRAANSSTSLERIFDRSWLLGLRYATASEWTYSIAVLNDTLNQGWLGQLRADARLTDGVLAGLAADMLDGGPGTPLGTYRRNDRVGASVTVHW